MDGNAFAEELYFFNQAVHTHCSPQHPNQVGNSVICQFVNAGYQCRTLRLRIWRLVVPSRVVSQVDSLPRDVERLSMPGALWL